MTAATTPLSIPEDSRDIESKVARLVPVFVLLIASVVAGGWWMANQPGPPPQPFPNQNAPQFTPPPPSTPPPPQRSDCASCADCSDCGSIDCSDAINCADCDLSGCDCDLSGCTITTRMGLLMPLMPLAMLGLWRRRVLTFSSRETK